jgi:hypothetical protein
VNVLVPLRIRALNNPGSTDEATQSENISQRDLYFSISVPLKIGTPVEASLCMLQELFRTVASDVKRAARVGQVRKSFTHGRHVGDRAAHRALRGQAFAARSLGEEGNSVYEALTLALPCRGQRLNFR